MRLSQSEIRLFEVLFTENIEKIERRIYKTAHFSSCSLHSTAHETGENRQDHLHVDIDHVLGRCVNSSADFPSHCKGVPLNWQLWICVASRLGLLGVLEFILVI